MQCFRMYIRHLWTRRAVSADSGMGHPVENIPPECFQNQNTASGTQGRSGLVRSALEKLSLFSPTFPVRQKYGAGNFAVCGQRLRGHVPSKNTSPAALSWSSLTSSTTPFLFVFARCFLLQSSPHKTKAPTASSYRRGFFICSF